MSDIFIQYPYKIEQVLNGLGYTTDKRDKETIDISKIMKTTRHGWIFKKITYENVFVGSLLLKTTYGTSMYFTDIARFNDVQDIKQNLKDRCYIDATMIYDPDKWYFK